MKTKVTLTIDNVEHEFGSDCLQNWDDVRCNFKRSSFSGVVRTFSSKFEFVGEAYDALLTAYLERGVKASGAVAVWTINNDWTFSKEFEAPIDFSSATWDGYVFTVNTLDNGMASLIKARKGTKYEFVLGEDIITDKTLAYDRVEMLNTVTHGIVGDGTADNGWTIINAADSFTRLPTYILNDDELYAGSAIACDDESSDSGAAIVSVKNNLSRLEITTDVTFDCIYNIEIRLFEFTDDHPDFDETYIDKGVVFNYSHQASKSRTYLGEFADLAALKSAYPIPPANSWAGVGEPNELAVQVWGAKYASVYYAPDTDDPLSSEWQEGSCWGFPPNDYCPTARFIRHFTLDNLTPGKKYALFYKTVASENVLDTSITSNITSKITSRWLSRGTAIDIDVITPKEVVTALLGRVCDEQYNVVAHFSDHDPRLAGTYIVAGESIRGITPARLYTTFNEFCEWMETVFGYTYRLGDPSPSRYISTAMFDGTDTSDMTVAEGECPSENVGEITYCPAYHKFMVYNTADGLMYGSWEGDTAYNDADGNARKDVVFESRYRIGSYFVVGDDWTLSPFVGDIDKYDLPTQDIYFVHRSELFTGLSQDIHIEHVNDLSCKVDTSLLYSTIEIGYPKQDYDSECGRDEWNFTNYYNTGIDTSDKKLTLQSKYRADCYGFEFLAQKRNQDTTDNESDSSVFFVLCNVTDNNDYDDDTTINEPTRLTINRSANIVGALSDTVFNGEFSPYACVMANEGYISAMAEGVTLRFASSDGNSDIVIDGIDLDTYIDLNERLFSELQVTFTTTYIEQSLDYSKLITVEKHGLSYSGYLTDTEICFARPSETKYTLIVKSIQAI